MIPKKQFDGADTIAALANRLSAYFLPASYATAPLADPAKNGGRVTALTSANTPNIRPSDATTLALAAGTATWTFTTKFNSTPVISALPNAAPPSSGTTLYISAKSNTSVTIKSTDATDARTLDLTAQGNPS